MAGRPHIKRHDEEGRIYHRSQWNNGSAILEYLVQTTTSEQWSKIITTSRSPFKAVISDPRVEFIALDFSQKPEVLAEKMRGICEEVTHAYFSSYIHKDDFAELNAANSSLFENFLSALLEVSVIVSVPVKRWQKTAPLGAVFGVLYASLFHYNAHDLPRLVHRGASSLTRLQTCIQ